MDTLLWAAQGFLGLTFLYSGLMKSTQPEQKLLAMGQTGVEHLPLPLIRFIGISELIGVAGLLIPGILNQWTFLTPLAALCLGAIMIPAGVIHYRRSEPIAVAFNAFIFVISLWVAYSRWRVSD